MATTQDMQSIIREMFNDQEGEQLLTGVTIDGVDTFDGCGLLTNNDGVVVTMTNGDVFQLTIVQARHGVEMCQECGEEEVDSDGLCTDCLEEADDKPEACPECGNKELNADGVPAQDGEFPVSCPSCSWTGTANEFKGVNA